MVATPCAISEIFSQDGEGVRQVGAFAVARSGRRQPRDRCRGRTRQMAVTRCAISEIFSPDGEGVRQVGAFAVARSGRGSPETTAAGEPGKWQRHTAQSVKIANLSDRSCPLLLAGKSGLTNSD